MKKVVKIAKFDINYFDNLDNQNKAYFLGLLAADGSIELKKNGCRLQLQEKDLHIIESLIKELQFTGNIGTHTQITKKNKLTTVHKRVTFTNKHFIDSLLKLGIIPNKSKKFSFPNISKEFIPHFIRGYFDGDGCFSQYTLKNTRPTGNIAIVGTNDFIKKLVKIVFENTQIKMGLKYHKNTTHCYATLGGVDTVKKLMDWLYKDANYYFFRKRNKYLTFCRLHSEFITKYPKKKIVYQFDKSKNLIATFSSLTEAGKILNIDFKAISQCCIGKSKTCNGYIFKYSNFMSLN